MKNLSFNSFKEKLSSELKVENLFDFHANVTEYRQKRNVVSLQPNIMIWNNNGQKERDFGFSPLEGSITLFWGYKKDSHIENLRRAYIKYDANELDSLQKKFAKNFTARRIPHSSNILEQVLKSKTLFDFSYNGKMLANNLWLSKDYNIGSLVFPYNGGKVSNSLFSIKEFNVEEGSSEYDYFIVINPPKLSRIEIAALDLVPEYQSELNISFPSHLAATPTALVTIAVFVLINTAVTTCCTPLRDKLAEVSLPETVIDKLGAVNSAKELLKIRATIFREFGF